MEVVTKLLPLMTKLISLLPAVTLKGAREVSSGTGLFTEKNMLLEAPPPGPGFRTVIGYTPATARSVPGIVTLIWVELTKMGVRVCPLKLIVDVVTKLDPVIERRILLLPAITELPENDVCVGTGLLIAKVIPLEVPPPGEGFDTTIWVIPAAARFEAGKVTLSWELLINWGVKTCPLKLIVDVVTKLDPVKITDRSALPAIVEAGFTVVSVGTELFTVKFRLPEFPPPGAILVTDIGYKPAETIELAGRVTLSWELFTNCGVKI